MNNKFARQLSMTITNQEVFDMLQRAKSETKDWTKPSKANKGISRGSHWNIFNCKDFDVSNSYPSFVKYRMIQEYGEFLPKELQPPKKPARVFKTTHFDPKF